MRSLPETRLIDKGQNHMRFGLLSLLPVVIFTMLISSQLNAEMSIQTASGRSAFYRGEELNLEVACHNTEGKELAAGEWIATIGGVRVAVAKAPALAPDGRSRTRLRIDTAAVHSGKYDLTVEWQVDGKAIASASLPLSVARRPNPDRMTVWLWPHQAFINTTEKFTDDSRAALDWWASLGLNNFSFTLGAKHGDDARKFWDYALAHGWTVCLQPEGGLTDVKLQSDDPDVFFRDSSGKYRSDSGTGSEVVMANPFHPQVQRWQDDMNRAHMEVASQYPQITTAFFNTEVIDSVTRNANVAGDRMIREELGFTEDAISAGPKFVKPNVIADDDPKYLYTKYVYTRGNGITTANQRTTAMIDRYRPDILTISDPYRSHALLGGFAGIDVVGTWTYLNPDPKFMHYVEVMRTVARAEGGKIPLSTVTLLNYPGELAPTDRWMMMDAGRLTVGTWINLSRAPQMLGYYFSSQCDPFGALQIDLKAPETKLNEFEMPRSTFEKLKELSEKVFKPYGPLIKQLDVSPRKIAVLSSEAARLYGQSPPHRLYYPNTQVIDFYILLAMAQLPADIVFDETIERFGLDDYDVLVLPKCDVLPESVYNAVLAFQKRGGTIIADQYLGPELPGEIIRFNFDFTYRTKVSAMAIAKNQSYAQWDDHLKPGSAEITQVQGVTAQDDQRIMESYAAELRKTLADRVPRQVDCDQPTALLNLTEADGVKYLFVVNDKREYGPRLGEHKSILEKIVPQTVQITLNDPALAGAQAYDLLKQKLLDSADGNLTVELDETGGTIVALYPRKLASVKVIAPSAMTAGKEQWIGVEIRDEQGGVVPGAQPLKVEITDPNGAPADVTDFYCASNGSLRIPFTPAVNDTAGQWNIKVQDLTAGLSTETSFTLEK
jgi:hypothetical protein